MQRTLFILVLSPVAASAGFHHGQPTEWTFRCGDSNTQTIPRRPRGCAFYKKRRAGSQFCPWFCRAFQFQSACLCERVMGTIVGIAGCLLWQAPLSCTNTSRRLPRLVLLLYLWASWWKKTQDRRARWIGRNAQESALSQHRFCPICCRWRDY